MSWLARVGQALPRLRQGNRNLPSKVRDGGAEGIRTPDPHNAIVVLYQLSYDPIQWAAICEPDPNLSKFFLVKLCARKRILAS